MFVWPAKRTAALKGENQAAEHRVWNWRNHACRRHGSPRLNSCFAPRLSTSTPHEPATPASHHPRVPAPPESLRLSGPQCPASPLSSLCQPPQRIQSRLATARAQPPTATSQLIRTCSTIYKTHTLPRGAASLKSLYLKRPSRAPRFDHLMKMAGLYTRNQ